MSDIERIKQDTAPPTEAERQRLLAFGDFIGNTLIALTPVLRRHNRSPSDVDAIFQALFDPDTGVFSTEAADFFANNDNLEHEYRLGDYWFKDQLIAAKRALIKEK